MMHDDFNRTNVAFDRMNDPFGAANVTSITTNDASSMQNASLVTTNAAFSSQNDSLAEANDALIVHYASSRTTNDAFHRHNASFSKQTATDPCANDSTPTKDDGHEHHDQPEESFAHGVRGAGQAGIAAYLRSLTPQEQPDGGWSSAGARNHD
jgi:hypothetical protein